MKNKEIIGYILIKNLPFASQGAMFTEENMREDYFNCNGGYSCNAIHLSTIQNTEWFLPVYKEKEITETVELYSSNKGTFKLEISKKGIYYAPDDRYLNRDFIKELIRVFSTTFHTREYNFSVQSIRAGCMDDTRLDDWQKVIDTYDRIMNS